MQSKSGARTVRRQPHEDLIDKMRDRMKTPEGKALYRQRGCTVERRFADAKSFRGLERFSGKTRERAEAQVGLTILVHNLITLDKLRRSGTEREKWTHPERLKRTHLGVQDGRFGQERRLSFHSDFRVFLAFIDSRKR